LAAVVGDRCVPGAHVYRRRRVGSRTWSP
jgi:hypothetical protein